MDNIQPIDNDEIEIDLKDLFLELVSFWKWILLAIRSGHCVCSKPLSYGATI